MIPVKDSVEPLNAIKPPSTIDLLEPADIVIAKYEVFVAFEKTKIVISRTLVSEEHVAEHIHRIISMNTAIPVVDQTTVHLFNGCERTVAMLDDVGMTKVQI